MSFNPGERLVRISSMAQHHSSRSRPSPGRAAETQVARLTAVVLSLRSAFGEGAMLVARGQPPLNDVGRGSGIFWQDVIDELVLEGQYGIADDDHRARDGT
jgi:hypothetical protein